MPINKKKSAFGTFFNNANIFPILAAIASGLYPFFFYYTHNYKLIKSWGHFGYFISLFILAPIVLFFVVDRVSRSGIFKKYRSYIIPFLNILFFLFFIKTALYAGFDIPKTILVFVIALVLTFLLKNFIKKVLVFQLILAFIGLVTLVPVIIKQLNYSKEWMMQPDDIEQAIFKKRPNIYFIQPDGYVNFSELGKGFYNIQNDKFESFLNNKGFKNYPDFHSNYAATLPTNSSVFMMKHHYYNNGSDFTETIDARQVIMEENSVLKTLKNNGYKTFFLTEQPYFLTSKPKVEYDFSNFSSEEIKFVTDGLEPKKDVIEPLNQLLQKETSEPNFFFVQIFNPGHIANRKSNSKGVEGERLHYIESLKESNKKLKLITESILSSDPEALIVIMADHGGFVGLEYTGDTYTKNENPDFVNSVFSSMMAIHWPNGESPHFDSELKSGVNLFRILFSYLSEDEKYLHNLQDDGSYIIINFGAPKGVYQYLDTEGNLTFKRYYEK